MSERALSGFAGPHDHRDDCTTHAWGYDVDRELRVTGYADGCITWSSASKTTSAEVAGQIRIAIARHSQRLAAMTLARDALERLLAPPSPAQGSGAK